MNKNTVGNALEAAWKRKPVRVLLILATVCYAVYCIRDFASAPGRRDTQALLRNMNAIMQQVDKLPPGLARGEELLRRTRALDPGMAPAEVKQALHDYTDALAGALEAMKAGRDSQQYDAAMASAKQRLADCFTKYRL